MSSANTTCAPVWPTPYQSDLHATIAGGRTWGPFLINALPWMVGWMFKNTAAEIIRLRVLLTLNGHKVSVLGAGCGDVPYATLSSEDFAPLIDYLSWSEISLSAHRDGFFWINDLSDADLESLIDDFLWSDA